MSIKFSIITCTWNSAATLRDTINSVETQDYSLVEHIFVDGGSTDGTLEMIAAYSPNARMLYNVKGGISRAMNAGIKVATGDVIAHLHSDDYYTAPDVLSMVSNILANGSQWAYGKIFVLRGDKLSSRDLPMKTFSLRRYAAGYVTVPHPAVFIRRTAFAEVGFFDEDLKYAMDIDLWFRLGARYTPAQIDYPLTVFREHAGSLSTANKLKAREEEWYVRLRYFRREPLATARYAIRYWRAVNRIRREMEHAKA